MGHAVNGQSGSSRQSDAMTCRSRRRANRGIIRMKAVLKSTTAVLAVMGAMALMTGAAEATGQHGKHHGGHGHGHAHAAKVAMATNSDGTDDDVVGTDDGSVEAAATDATFDVDVGGDGGTDGVDGADQTETDTADLDL